MENQTDIGYLTCPKCGSKNIDEFKNAYWFLCRDCGHNGMPSSDEAKAAANFLGDADEKMRNS